MASIKTVERQIGNLEGFDVRFRHPDGRDVRSDKGGIPGYAFYEKMAKSSWTVSTWKELRFKQKYPGYECEVLDAAGNDCHGGTLLSTVRETYTE